MFSELKENLSFLKKNLFLRHLTICVFFVMAEYGITRPTGDSFFLSQWGASMVPYVYLAGIPFNLLIIYLYNRFLPSLGCLKMFSLFCFFVVICNTLCAFFISDNNLLSFFQYLWKEIYILLIFKQIWSMIHTTVDGSKAKYFYGVLFGIGSVGAICGTVIPGFFAVSMGSKQLFLFTAPIYFLVLLFYYFAKKRSSIPDTKEDFQKMLLSDGEKSKGGFALIRNSRFLMFILLLVVFMQLSVYLVQYQFYYYLENMIPNLDLRTQYTGRVHSITNGITIFFQFIGAFVFIRFLGLRKAHLLVPMILCINTLIFLVNPSFMMISYIFISIKSIDYSFFQVIREMLYVPLKPEEKFRAKAVIDVFTFRSAKAMGALLILFFQRFFQDMIPMITSLSVMLFVIWAICVYGMFRREEEEFKAIS